MFALCCEIKIGSVSFKSVHDVKIKRSLYDLMATATIKVPVTAETFRGTADAYRDSTGYQGW